jgi:hypothetical protein
MVLRVELVVTLVQTKVPIRLVLWEKDNYRLRSEYRELVAEVLKSA